MRAKSDPAKTFLEARLKFRHLRLLVALDEHRNIIRAAESIGLSQPGASKLLADMERILEVRLFDRYPRGLEPNELGAIFIRRARIIVSELNKASTEFFAQRTGHLGAVSVGALGTRGLELIAKASESMRIRELHPNIQVWADVESTEYLMKRVSDGILDFVVGWVTPDIDPAIFSVEKIGEEKFNFICGSEHPLLKKDRVQLEDLVGADWVLQSSDSLVRRAAESLFAAKGLPIPSPIATATSLLSMLIFLQETNAVSVATTSAVRRFSLPGGFRALPVEEAIEPQQVGIVALADAELKPTARTFLEAIREAVKR